MRCKTKAGCDGLREALADVAQLASMSRAARRGRTPTTLPGRAAFHTGGGDPTGPPGGARLGAVRELHVRTESVPAPRAQGARKAPTWE